MEEYKIVKHLDDIVDIYKSPTQRVDGLIRNPKDIIRTIEFYTASEFTTGKNDELGREKPFYNAVNYRTTIAKIATDLDVKDIRFEPDSIDYSVQAMLINHELYKFLKEINFSLTLNEMALTRPKYGGVLVKKSRQNGTIKIDVVDWVNVDFDPSDILGGTIVETFYMFPSELSEKSDIWENVDEVIGAHKKLNKNKPAKIEVKEINGVFPEDFDPNIENPNDKKYKRMCFYVACVGKKKFYLYSESDADLNFKYLPWEAIGKGLGRGVVEDGFNAQVWINDAMISMKNAMELSGKVILATDSQKVGGNVITGVDNGHIFELEPGRSITSLNLSASALPQFQNIIDLWNQQYDRSASTFDANTGESPTAGTPYSQTALLNQVANSPFEFRREEFGIFLNEILNDWIMPEIKKRITKAHYLQSEFSDDELKIIDEAIINSETNKKLFEMTLNDIVPTPLDQQMIAGGISESLAKFGSKREIEIPEKFLDVEGHLTCNITGELKNKSAILQSLDSIFKTVVATFNPNTGKYAALEDPALSKIFGMIIETAGVPLSSAQLKSGVSKPDLSALQPAQPMQPVQ